MFFNPFLLVGVGDEAAAAKGCWTDPDTSRVYEENSAIFFNLALGITKALSRGEISVLLVDGQRLGWLVQCADVLEALPRLETRVLTALDLIELPNTVQLGYWHKDPDASDYTELKGVRYTCSPGHAPDGSHLVLVH